jgi:hypothetical protein
MERPEGNFSMPTRWAVSGDIMAKYDPLKRPKTTENPNNVE